MVPWRVRKQAALVLFTVLVALPFGAVTAAEEGTSISVELQEFEDSGISGTAILTATAEGGTQVSMELQGAELDGDHPTHIHTGTCDDFDPDPLYPLETVELSAVNQEGISETTVEDVTLDSLREGDYVILVHQSLEELTNYLVCGEISGGTQVDAAEAEQESDDDQAAAADHPHGDTDEAEEDAEDLADVGTAPQVGSGDAVIAATKPSVILPVILGALSLLAMLGAVVLRRRES